MKFKELVERFEKLYGKHKRGKSVKQARLEELQQLLADKKERYELKLASTELSDKRKKLQARLKVVNAQLEKTRKLASEK